MTDDRAAYIRAVIMARCGDLITPADLALMAEPDISAEVIEALLDTLDAVEARLETLERPSPRVTH